MIRSLLALSLAALGLAAQTPPADPGKAKPAPVVAPPTEAKVLKVGDPAPAFKVGRWVKGTPVADLKKGQIYVVEFWATWCPPCKDSIPHLTELSKKLAGKVTFIGVDVWERAKPGEDIDATVDAFVKEMGAKMDYAVCRDGADSHMTKAWMQAAAQRGIPAAFIVDGTGTLAYIGNPHPSNKAFEAALEQIVAGTWDVKAAAVAAEKAAAAQREEEAKAKAQQAAWKEVSPALLEAQKAKDWAKVLTLADAAEAKYPDLKENLERPRFLALAATDPAKAQALIDASLAKADVPTYMNTASLLLSEQGLDRRWAEQALACIDKAVALDPKLEPRVAGLRLKALLRTDPAKAREAFEAGKAKGNAPALAMTVLEVEGLEKSFVASAVAVLEEAQKDPKAPKFRLQSLAAGYFTLGQPAKAAAAQETFIAWAKEAGAPAPFLAEAEATLRKYQAAAK